MTHANDPQPPPVKDAQPASRSVSTADLLGTARELRIVHHGEQYTLRITRLNKLILTK